MKKENPHKDENILLNLTVNYQEMLLCKEFTLLDRGDLSRHKILQ